MTPSTTFHEELEHLRRVRLENRWPYWRLSEEVERVQGVKISPSLLRKWLRRETRPHETSWYAVQQFLAAQSSHEVSR